MTETALHIVINSLNDLILAYSQLFDSLKDSDMIIANLTPWSFLWVIIPDKDTKTCIKKDNKYIRNSSKFLGFKLQHLTYIFLFKFK